MYEIESNFKATEATEILFLVGKIAFYCGIPSMWVEEPQRSKIFTKIYWIIVKMGTAVVFIFILTEWGGLLLGPSLGRTELSDKQKSSRNIFIITHPIMFYLSYNITQHRDGFRRVLYCLEVVLKVDYNDIKVEKEMVKKIKWYISAFIVTCGITLIIYAIDSLVEVLQNGGTFNPVYTIWPDITDTSKLANLVRAINYISWWIFMIRSSAAYILVIVMTICLSHQFQNLRSYFDSMKQIFDKDITQMEKETLYANAVKLGIKMHSDTLWCTELCQMTCSAVFTGQILVNVSALVMSMLQFADIQHSNAMTTLSFVLVASSVLIPTGVFMCNAGDVTVEASHLATAIYLSGWENCHLRPAAIRQLLVPTMAVSQKPVLLRSHNFILLSYQSYVRIIKSSYSIFSFLY